MTAKPQVRHKTSPRGLFLFFVLGLFLLQVAFAFTIHGDIGPQSPLVPGMDRPAPPLLVGRIDALVTQPTMHKPVRPAPEAVMAPATREVPRQLQVEDTRRAVPRDVPEKPAVTPDDGRFCSYTVTRGDTLADISRKLYGNTTMVTSLVRLNRIQDERRLKLGQALRVPRTGLLRAVAGNH